MSERNPSFICHSGYSCDFLHDGAATHPSTVLALVHQRLASQRLLDVKKHIAAKWFTANRRRRSGVVHCSEGEVLVAHKDP